MTQKRMRTIEVAHFGGTTRVVDSGSLDALLTERNAEGFNEFWISGEAKFPVLVISVREQNAAVHFFPEDRNPGFHSIRHEAPGNAVVLRTIGEEIQVASEAIVSFEDARRAAHEFVDTLALPTTLKWFQL